MDVGRGVVELPGTGVLRTSDIATAVGVYPNTVRLYSDSCGALRLFDGT